MYNYSSHFLIFICMEYLFPFLYLQSMCPYFWSESVVDSIIDMSFEKKKKIHSMALCPFIGETVNLYLR